VNRINKNVDLLKKLDTVKLISPRDITIASIPLIIQRALILGPKFIYDNSLSTNKIVSQLRNNRAVKLNSEQFRHLTNDLNNAPPSKKPQAINTKDLKTVMKRWLDDNNLIIQNADKNLCLALIDKDIYQQHLDALISNTDLTSQSQKLMPNNSSRNSKQLFTSCISISTRKDGTNHTLQNTPILASPTCTSSPF
jgi:hypothetical protein